MNRNILGGIVVVAGLVLLVVSALAEPIGIGDGGGFGWKQVTGVIVGAVAIVIGLLVMYWRRGEPRTVQPGA
jgi:uncharacterized membrane protein